MTRHRASALSTLRWEIPGIVRTNRLKNCETFAGTLADKTAFTGTLKKIFRRNNSIRQNRSGNLGLGKFVSQELIPTQLNDHELKAKINRNKNKLRFDKEMRGIYTSKYELQSIKSEPVFPEYIGHRFRKCYEETAFNKKDSVMPLSEVVTEQNENLDNIESVQQSAGKEPLREESMKSGETMVIEKKLPELTSEWEDIHQKHLIESLQAYQYLNDLTAPEFPPTLLEKDKFVPENGKKLLVFDMDETLLHWIPDPKEDTVWDVKIPYKYEKYLKYKYLNLRPFVVECLLELSKKFQIVVFTASVQEYADPLLDYLDRQYGVIQKRFYRHHCYRTQDEVTMKDLRIFEQWGFDMKDVILVDNATHWFGFQINNGLPMVPFYDNKEDKEMIHILHYLENFVDINDIRPVLSETFQLSKLRVPHILEKVEGVIEYEIQDVSDEDLILEGITYASNKDTNYDSWDDDIPTEGEICENIDTLKRKIPTTKPSNTMGSDSKPVSVNDISNDVFSHEDSDANWDIEEREISHDFEPCFKVSQNKDSKMSVVI